MSIYLLLLICFSFTVFIWDIVLVNEKDTSSFNQNDLSLFNSAFILYSNGTVYFGRDISSNVQCRMNLRSYPHDIQNCSMNFISYARTAEDMKLNLKVTRWKNFFQSSDFNLIGISWYTDVRHVAGSNMSVAIINIELQREITVYLYQVNSYYFSIRTLNPSKVTNFGEFLLSASSLASSWALSQTEDCTGKPAKIMCLSLGQIEDGIEEPPGELT